MATEVAAAANALKAALKRRKKMQLSVDNWAVCSQLRRTVRGGVALAKTKGYPGLGNLQVTPQRKACSRQAGAHLTGNGQSGSTRHWSPPRQQRACLNEMGDKAAGKALVQVKESMLVMEKKIEEDQKWARRAL